MKSKIVRLSLGTLTAFMLVGCGQGTTENSNVNEYTKQDETSISTVVDEGLGESDITHSNVEGAAEDDMPDEDVSNDFEKIHLDGYNTEITLYNNEPDPGKYRKYANGAEKYLIQYLENWGYDSSEVQSRNVEENKLFPKYIYMTPDWKVYIGKGYRYDFYTEDVELSIIYCPDLDKYINYNNEVYGLSIYTAIADMYGGYDNCTTTFMNWHDDWTDGSYCGYFEPECNLENFVDFRAELLKYNGGGEVFMAQFVMKGNDGTSINEEKLEEFLAVYDRYAERATDEFNERGVRVVSFVVK